MDVVIEEVTSATRRMKFVLPGADVGDEMNQITRNMTKTVSLPGFRKGKVPFDVVKRKFLDQIKNDAILALAGGRVKDALKEFDINPVRQPYIENFTVDESTDDYEITISYEVFPEIDDPSLSGESMINPQLELSEDDIDTVIERWQSEFQAYESIDGPAVQNDMLGIQVEPFRDGQSIWGAPQAVEITLDEDDEDSPLEFIHACTGKSKGDKFKITCSRDVLAQYDDELETTEDADIEVASEEVEYEIEISKIDRPKPNEFSDRFLDMLGVSGREDENFRARAREEIERQYARQREKLIFDQAGMMLLKRNSFMPPESLVGSQVVEHLKSYGLNEQNVANEINAGMESPILKMAYSKVLFDMKYSMILDKVRQDREITFDDGDFEQYIENYLDSYKHLTQQESEEFRQQLVESMRHSHLEEFQRQKIMEVLLEDIEMTEQTMGLAEFETWIQSAQDFVNRGPMPEVSEEPDEAEVKASSDEVSMIVDASGNPIDKSKP